MKNISNLKEIAESLNLNNLILEINNLENKINQNNAELIFPLIGEFSAGKTTLINALIDNKKLETSITPTTSTIYEIHFGSNTSKAEIVLEDGSIKEIENIEDLNNDDLIDTPTIKIFDTSNKIPKETIIVDTPGLSSPTQKHRDNLMNFLPYADGMFLVIDINQPSTRSLMDFISTMKLSEKPIYVIITKSDTKAENEIESVKKYFSNELKLPTNGIACVSALEDNLDEFYNLLKDIQKKKNEIVKKTSELRIKSISENLLSYIDDLLKNAQDFKSLENSIKQQDYDLRTLKRNVEKIIENVKFDTEQTIQETSKKFEDNVKGKLENIVSQKNIDYDAEVNHAINDAQNILFSNYIKKVQDSINEQIRKQNNKESEISFDNLREIDFSSLKLDNTYQNLSLNTAGKEYNKMISTGVKVLAATAAVVAIVSTAGAAGVAGAAASGSAALEIADTATDLGNMASNAKSMNRMQKLGTKINKLREHISEGENQLKTIEESNQAYGEKFGTEQGIVESIVSWATDSMLGKPQRKKRISSLLSTQIIPAFNQQLETISSNILTTIQSILDENATSIINQKRDNLLTLQKELSEQKENYKTRMTELKNFKKSLINGTFKTQMQRLNNLKLKAY
ncbi:dynamin family protein, partial [Ornithobacterium rhinotracheale]